MKEKKTSVAWTSNKHTTHFEDCGCFTEALEKQIDALRAYARHKRDCEFELEIGLCTCGFDKALQQSPRKGRK